ADATYNKEKVFFSDPFPRFTQISGLVAKEQKTKAYQAIILSLIVLLIYIAVRFPNGWIYGVGAIAALTHDVLISLGCIAVFGYLGWVSLEINLTTIAALLTLVGYSLNDTIVIYDRIRENKKNYDAEIWARMDIKHVEAEFNKALNQTLSRTLLTSVTTMIVLACIFFLNYGKGSVMEGFSFILMIGIITGTYSSIFVATAIVLGLEKRNREQ
ncbi:MAG TPA: protein translocase subunit SecF, partial [Planctomycetota bacterium]|nr:protein translocase subunit SecF [Planctomycetota bacterium]